MVSTHTLEHPKSAVARFDSLHGLTPGGVANVCSAVAFRVADKSFSKALSIEAGVRNVLLQTATVLQAAECVIAGNRPFVKNDVWAYSLSMSNVLRLSVSNREIVVIVRTVIRALGDRCLSISHLDRTSIHDASWGLGGLGIVRNLQVDPLDDLITCVLRTYCRSAGIQIPALNEGRVAALLAYRRQDFDLDRRF